MPTSNHLASRLHSVLALSILLGSLASVTSNAQTSTRPQTASESTAATADPPSAFINIETNRDIGPNVAFSYETALAPKYNFARILSAALGCELQDKHLSLNDYGMTEIDARCDFPLRRTWLVHAGGIELQPFKELLHGESGYACRH